MEASKIIFVINDSVRAIRVSYEPGKSDYIFKTLDPSIQVDDYVVVPTESRHKMTVCKVTEVDVDVDLEDSMKLFWIIGRVDYAAHEDILAKEQEAIAAVNSAERRRKREELRASMFKDQEALMESLQLVDHKPEPKTD